MKKRIKKALVSIWVLACITIGCSVPAFAEDGGGVSFSSVMELLTKFTTAGGALWLLWGVIVLAGALKDKNGPALQSGIWQIVGGALILAASILFTVIVV